MAFARVAGTASGNNKTAANTISTGVPNATLPAGDLIIVIVAMDNTATVDGDNGEVTSITDSVGGNTWTKLREFTNSQAAAAGGATLSIWYSILTNAIGTVGTSITANLANTVAAKIIIAQRFTLAAGKTVAIAGVQDIAVDAATGFGVPSITGLTNEAHLWLLAYAAEGTGGETATGYNSSGGFITTGGAAATNISTSLQDKESTSTGETPTITTVNSADKAVIFLALREATPSAFSGGEDDHALPVLFSRVQDDVGVVTVW